MSAGHGVRAKQKPDSEECQEVLRVCLHNLPCQMERLPNPFDLFCIPIWERARRRCLERGGLSKEQNVKGNWTNRLSVAFSAEKSTSSCASR